MGTKAFAEIFEEFRVRRQHKGGVAVGQRHAIGLKRTVKAIELRIGLEGVGIDLGGFVLALAAQNLGLALGFRRDDHSLAVGAGADFKGAFLTLGPGFGGFALTLGFHTA